MGDVCTPLSVCRYMLFYLIWRTLHGLHRSITLNFMVAGHTKFAPDWCFGLLKMRFRRSRVSCLGDIEELTNASTVTGVNVAQLVGTEDQQVNVRLYDWQTFLSPCFKPLPGMKQYHHFRSVLYQLRLMFTSIKLCQSLIYQRYMKTTKLFGMSSCEGNNNAEIDIFHVS